jgi:hypothetical protein
MPSTLSAWGVRNSYIINILCFIPYTVYHALYLEHLMSQNSYIINILCFIRYTVYHALYLEHLTSQELLYY